MKYAEDGMRRSLRLTVWLLWLHLGYVRVAAALMRKLLEASRFQYPAA